MEYTAKDIKRGNILELEIPDTVVEASPPPAYFPIIISRSLIEFIFFVYFDTSLYTL